MKSWTLRPSGKVRKRVTAFFLLLLAAAGFLSWWNYGVPAVESRLQARLESLLAREMGRKVQIGRVVLHPLLINLSFNDIIVETPNAEKAMGPQAAPIFQCERILVRLTPHRLRLTRPWFAFALGNVIVDKPEIHVKAGSFSTHVSPKSRALAFPLLLLQVEWRDGKLNAAFREDKPPLQVDQWSGHFILTKPGITLETAARAANGPLKAVFRVKDWKSWEAVVRQDKASLSELADNSPVPLPGTLEGRADAELQLSGTWPPKPADVRWRLSGRVRDGRWLLPEAEIPVPFSGRFDWRPDRLRLREMRVARDFTLSGQCDGALGPDASVDFALRADGLNLDEARRMVPASSFLAHLPIGGSASLEGRVKGTVQDPVLNVKSKITNPRISFIAFPVSEAVLEATRSDIRAEVSSLQGNISVTGRRDDDSSQWAWEVGTQKLDLRQWAELNRWGNIAGTLSGRFSMRGVPPAATAEGRLEIDKVTWGVHQDTGTLAMRLNFSNDRLELKGEGRALHVDMHRSGNRWVLSQLDFNLPDGLSLAGRGEWDRGDGRLNGFVSLRNVSLRDVPIILKSYPGIEGRFDFDGNLSGVMGAPVFQGDCRLIGLRLREGGMVQDGQASLEWTRRRITFSTIKLGEALSGSGVWSQSDGWNMTASIRDLDAEFVAEIIRSTEILSGRWDGSLSMSGDKDGLPRADGRLVWRDGGVRGVYFHRAESHFHVLNGRLEVERFEVRQASGSLQARGSLPASSSGGPLSLALHFQQFSLGAASLDGEMNVAGEFQGDPLSLRGQVRSPSFWVNGIGLGASQGELILSRAQIRLSDLRALEGTVRAHVDVDLTGKSLSVSVEAKSVDLEDAAARWPSAPAALSSGTLSGRLTLEGPMNGFTGGLHLDWDHVRWNGVPFSGSLDGEWAAPWLKISSLKFNLPEGGAASGRANVFLSQATSTVQGDLNFTNVPLSETFKAAALPSFLSGRWAGRLSCEGDLKNPLVRGDVTGENARWKDTVFPRWDARFSFQNRQMDLHEFQAKTAEGLWRVNPGSRIFFTKEGEGHLQLVQDLRNIHLGPLSLFGGLEIVGTWHGGASPSFEADLRARSLWVNQLFFNQDLAHMVWTEKKLVFSPLSGSLQAISGAVYLDKLPQVELEDVTLSEQGRRRLWINGEVGPNLWDFELQGWELEAEALISLADLDIPVSGKLNAQITGQGNPRKPNVEGHVFGKEGYIGLLPYDHLSAAILWKGPFVEIKDLEAARKSGYSVKGSGRIPVGDDEKLSDQMSIVMRLTNGDLHILRDIWPDCRSAEGSFHGELQLFSGEDDVRMAGYLTVENGRLSASRYVKKVTDFNARLLLQDDRLTVENISGRVGRGRLVVQGKMGMRGLDVSDYDLSIQSVGSRGIEIEVPQLSVPPGPLLKRFSLLRESLEGVSNGAPLVYVRVEGPSEEPHVTGTVILNDTQFTYPPANKDAARPHFPWLRDFVNDAVWDIEFRSGNNTWYRNEFVNVQMDGSLGLLGKRGSMAANGKLTTQRGVINYLGQTFNVKTATFEIVTDTRSITNDLARVPYLSGTAEREMVTLDDRGVPTPDTIIMTVSRAPLGEIQPRFISRNRPSLSSERVAQIALGFQEDSSNPLVTTQNPQLRDQVLRAGLVQLVGSTAGPLATRIANRFGIDMLYPIYEPKETGTTEPSNLTASQLQQQQRNNLGNYLEGTGASMGVQLSNRVFGAYKFTVDQTQNQYFFHDELELTYRVKGNLHLKASTELDTQRLLGQPPNRQAVLENQWRFGPPRPSQKRSTTQEKDDSDNSNAAP